MCSSAVSSWMHHWIADNLYFFLNSNSNSDNIEPGGGSGMATDTISYSFLFIHYTLTTYCGSTEMQKVCCDKVNVKKCVSVTKPVVRTRATWRLWWPILWQRQQPPPFRTPTRTATPYLTHPENSWKLKNCNTTNQDTSTVLWTVKWKLMDNTTFWWHGITKSGISCSLLSNDATKLM